MRALTFCILLSVSAMSVKAQGWVVQIGVDINHGGCAIEELTSVKVVFDGREVTGSSSGSRVTLSLSGTTLSSEQKLEIVASGKCLQSYDQTVILPFTESYSTTLRFSDCTTTSYSSDAADNIDIDGVIDFYPRMATGVPQLSCNRATVAAVSCASRASFRWQFSEAETGPWYDLAGTTREISVTADDIHHSSFSSDKYKTRYVRVMTVGGTASSARAVNIPPPPPVITSVRGIAPVCPDGEGSIEIVHSSATPVGVEFIYTVIQYVRERDGSCPSGYGAGNSLTQADLDALPASCGAGDGISLGSARYCSGFIGNYERTFNGTNLRDVLTPGNSIEQISAEGAPTGNFLKLFPGIYLVEVEPSGLAEYQCVCSFVVEIPASSAILSVPESQFSVTSPSCRGGNDGSAIVPVSIRSRYDQSYDIKYTLTRQTASGFTVYRSRENIKTNLASGKLTLSDLEQGNYRLKVWDNCSNYPVTSAFSVGDGSPLTVRRSRIHPSCLTDADNNGEAESGNGRIIVTATALTGKTYSYFLYSSGGTLLKTVANTSSNRNPFGDLVDGGYYTTVRTSNNCKGDSALTVLNAPPLLALQANAAGPACSNGTAGAITLTDIQKSSGTISFSYVLVNAATGSTVASSTGVSAFPTYEISRSIPTGTYNLTVTDQCVVYPNRISVNGLKITAPAAVELAGQDDIWLACADGSTQEPVFIRPGGGSLPYSFTFDKDGREMVRQDEIRDFEIPLPALAPGSYIATVTDSCGVEDIVEFAVRAPRDPLVVSIERMLYDNNRDGVSDSMDAHLTCFESRDGTLSVTVSGGVRGGAGTDYQIELLDESGEILVNNMFNSEDVRLKITNTGASDGVIGFEIGGLDAARPYSVRVSDFNTRPGACQKTLYRDAGGELLMLRAPLPLRISAPTIADFGNLAFFNDTIYARCHGDTIGTFKPVVSGGNSPYNIALLGYDQVTGDTITRRNPGSDRIFTGIGAGAYHIAVYDQQGCRYEPVSFVVGESRAVLRIDSVAAYVYPNGANVSCPGTHDASIGVEIAGGSSPYSFRLSSPRGEMRLTKSVPEHSFLKLPASDGPAALVYEIDVTDGPGCVVRSGPIRLSEPAPVSLSASVISDVGDGFAIPCRGDQATVRVSSQGGKFPHFIAAAGRDELIVDTADFVDVPLPAGSHFFTATDDMGCAADTVRMVLNEPDRKIGLRVLDVAPTNCVGGKDGMVVVSGEGGVPFNQSDSLYYAYSIRSTDDSLTEKKTQGLAANYRVGRGGYMLRAEDKYGCNVEENVIVPDDPTPLTLEVDSVASPSCYGGNDGFIRLRVMNAGGSGQLHFRLSGGYPGAGVSELTSRNADTTFFMLPATDINGHLPFSAWVDDAYYCRDTAFQFIDRITVPSPPEIRLDALAITRPSCEGEGNGSAVTRISGGQSPYRYSLDSLTYKPAGEDGVVVFNKLFAGRRLVFVRDSKFQPGRAGCQRKMSLEIPPGRSLDILSNVKRVSCYGGSDGAISLTPLVRNRPADESVEGQPLILSVRNAANRIVARNQTLVENLPAGIFTAEAIYDMDSSVCRIEKSIILSQPADSLRVAQIRSYPNACARNEDGKALVTLSGGWTDDALFYSLDGKQWEGVDGNPFLIRRLDSGSYRLMVARKGFLCLTSRGFSVADERLELVAGKLDPTCPGATDGKIILSPPGLTYILSDSVRQTVPMFDDLKAGTYRVLALADSTCLSDTVVVRLVDPTYCEGRPLAVTGVATTPATCHASRDGRASVNVMGGMPPYQYAWDEGDFSDTNNADTLRAGTHSVSVRDVAGNIAQLRFAISAMDTLLSEVNTTRPACSAMCDGSISVDIRGGSGKYDIRWQDGSDVSTREMLCPGTYSYIVSDASSRACSHSVKVELRERYNLSIVTRDLSSPTCPGGDDGYVSIAVAGGSGDYMALWRDGVKGFSRTNCSSGEYIVDVYDTRYPQCDVTDTLRVSDADSIRVVTVISQPPSCHDSKDSRVELNVDAVGAPLIQWETGQIGPLIANAGAGTLRYRVLDARGCSLVDSVEIESPVPMVATAIAREPSCHEHCDGQIGLDVQGGTAPYSILWNTRSKLRRISQLCAGVYKYVVTDARGCRLPGEVLLGQPPPLRWKADISDAGCYGKDDGSATLQAEGGRPEYEFVWHGKGEGSQLTKIGAGDYSFEIRDRNGCAVRGSVNVRHPSPLRVTLLEVKPPSCHDSADGAANVEIAGGTAPYVYFWNNVPGPDLAAGLRGGMVQLHVVDGHSCQLARFVQMPAPPPLEIVNLHVREPSCYGEANGSVDLDVSGGTFPIAWYWNGEKGSPTLADVAAGTYVLTIVDDNGCTTGEIFELKDPPALRIEGIADQIIACPGTLVRLAPSGTWSGFLWKGPAGFSSPSSTVMTDAPGNYSLIVTDSAGCRAEKNFSVTFAEDVLKADFLRITEPVVFQPVVFVDISNPPADRVEWVVPEAPSIIVNKKTQQTLELLFTEAGSFAVGIRAASGRCFSEVFREVTVVDNSGRKEEGRSSTLPQLEMTVHPNPASDHLRIQVLTSDPRPVQLAMIHVVDNHVIATKSLSGSATYDLTLDLSAGVPGVYTLLCRQGDALLSRRVVVIK